MDSAVDFVDLLHGEYCNLVKVLNTICQLLWNMPELYIMGALSSNNFLQRLHSNDQFSVNCFQAASSFQALCSAVVGSFVSILPHLYAEAIQ